MPRQKSYHLDDDDDDGYQAIYSIWSDNRLVNLAFFVCVWSLCLVQIAIVVVFIGHNHHDHIIIIIMTMMIMMIKSTIGHKWQSYMKLWPQWWFSDSVIIIIAVFFVMGGDDDDQWSLLYNTSSIDIIYNIIIDFFSIDLHRLFICFFSIESIDSWWLYIYSIYFPFSDFNCNHKS